MTDSRAILGVNYSGGHDSSVSLVSADGDILLACALERVSRHKQDGRPPRALLAGIDYSQVARCALPCYGPDGPPALPTGQRFHSLLHNRPAYPIHPFSPSFYAFLDDIPLEKTFVGHELAHAAAAYYLSGFPEAVVLAYDAGMYNEPWFGGVFRARGPAIDAVEMFPAETNAKIASLYAVITGVLDFLPLRHEGKVTGLAAYAEPDATCLAVINDLLTARYEQLEAVARWINPFSESAAPQFVVDAEQRTAIRREFGRASDAQVAASLQYATEQHLLEIVQRIRAEGWSSRLCLGGGLFANVKLNQRIHEAWGGEVFVAPPMGDEGVSLGAALYEAHKHGSARFPNAPRTMYLGPASPPADTQALLEQEGIVGHVSEDPALDLARLLASGRTVALFRGKMEFGPRALGNRSILAQATDPDINTRLNAQLRRTEFMPFAPITRVEDAALEYEGLRGAERAAEFMTITFNVTDHFRQSCPAAVHVDGTARPQLVAAEANPFLHGLLTAYHSLSGITSLINTSFNVHEEPIVCTPEDALKGFFEAQLDCLFLDGHLVHAEDNTAASVRYLGAALARRPSRDREQADLIEHLWRERAVLQAEADRRLAALEATVEARRQPANGEPDHQPGDEPQRDETQREEPPVDELRLDEPPRGGSPPGEPPRIKPPAPDLVAPTPGLGAAPSAPPHDALAVLDVGSGVPVAVLESVLTPVLTSIRNLESQVIGLLGDPDTRLRVLQREKEAAEAAAEARLQVIEQQERALAHYRFWSVGERWRRFSEPRLGQLYQYEPRPLEIPPYYTRRERLRETPVVSLVTPSYNQGQFIERTIRSVLEQEYPALEYGIQDGGSTDTTLDVLRAREDRLAWVESKRDEGLGHALNLGFARTTGPIMAYLNSDDVLLPGALLFVVKFFLEHPDVDVVYGHRVVLDEYDAEIGRWILPPHDDAVLTWADYIPQETLFWRRSIWDKAGGHIDQSFRFAVDWDLLLRFQAAGARFVRLPRFLGGFRVHPHQKTSSEMADVGSGEMDRLRERVHGRGVTRAEIQAALRPYLRQHLLLHKLWRAGVVRY